MQRQRVELGPIGDAISGLDHVPATRDDISELRKLPVHPDYWGHRKVCSRVERRRVAGRVRWLIRCFRSRAAVRFPWARVLPPLSEPGGPVSGTGLSSGIMRLAHGFPIATNGRVSRTVAPGPHPCVGRPVCRQTC